eukprot:1159202-Pelagomonas_calceolata.AAC.15
MGLKEATCAQTPPCLSACRGSHFTLSRYPRGICVDTPVIISSCSGFLQWAAAALNSLFSFLAIVEQQPFVPWHLVQLTLAAVPRFSPALVSAGTKGPERGAEHASTICGRVVGVESSPCSSSACALQVQPEPSEHGCVSVSVCSRMPQASLLHWPACHTALTVPCLMLRAYDCALPYVACLLRAAGRVPRLPVWQA